MDYLCPSHLEAPHLHQCLFEGSTIDLNGTLVDPKDPDAGTYFAKQFDASEVRLQLSHAYDLFGKKVTLESASPKFSNLTLSCTISARTGCRH